MESLDQGRFQAAPRPRRDYNGFYSEELKDLRNVIKQRRATTSFLPTPIPNHILENIIELTLQAPSGFNLQPWRFILIQDPIQKEKLKQAAFNQKKIIEAPVTAIALGMKETWKKYIRQILTEGNIRGAGTKNVEKAEQGAINFLEKQDMKVWVTRHTMIAVTYMMLIAESYGISTAPMEGFDPHLVKTAFYIPEEAEIVALLSMGYANTPIKAYPGRLSKNELVYFDVYGGEEE